MHENVAVAPAETPLWCRRGLANSSDNSACFHVAKSSGISEEFLGLIVLPIACKGWKVKAKCGLEGYVYQLPWHPNKLRQCRLRM